jgi:hypothetical protein
MLSYRIEPTLHVYNSYYLCQQHTVCTPWRDEALMLLNASLITPYHHIRYRTARAQRRTIPAPLPFSFRLHGHGTSNDNDVALWHWQRPNHDRTLNQWERRRLCTSIASQITGDIWAARAITSSLVSSSNKVTADTGTATDVTSTSTPSTSTSSATTVPTETT